MLKKKPEEQPKKKEIAVNPEPEVFNPPKVEEKKVVLCDCGKPVHAGSHQCWACSHRS